MKKNKSVGSYKEASYDTGGLFGSSTTNKTGTTYNPTGAMTKLNNKSFAGWQNALNQLNNFNNRDFTKDPNYQVYSDRLQNQMRSNYNNNVLNTLANNGLMRSSGLLSSTNAFNDTLANQTADLYDRYYNNQLNYLNNKLSANQNSANSLYNYLMGVTSGSQNSANNVNQYALSQQSANNAAKANNNAMYMTLANGVAGLTTSDMRAKKNIKYVGKKNGFNIYEFEYIDGLGLPKGRFKGVIAQEVEAIKPEAVITIDGIKRVDYSKLGIEMECA